jgi:hypothetical protein
MEMPVALRSASALGSPLTLFRFRRFGTNTMVLLSIQSSHQGEPTNSVTGPSRGAVDCRDEAEILQKMVDSFKVSDHPTISNFQFLYSNQKSCV